MAGQEQIGLRNKLRAGWQALDPERRSAITVGLQAGLSVLFYFVDHGLGFATAIIFSILWARRLPPFPWRLLIQALLMLVFVIAWAASNTNGWVALLFGTAFLISWIPRKHRRWALPASAFLLAVGYPFIVGHLFTIPVFGQFPDVLTGVYMVVFVMMAVGLNIVVGYAGLLDLGYVAFYAIGSYTAGWFASGQFAGQKCPNPKFGTGDCPVGLVPKHDFSFGGVGVPIGTGGFHVSIFLIVLIAGVITALFGVIIGLPTLRLRGDYLAIVTLGFGEILPQIARNGDSLHGFNLTNGSVGITAIDAPGFGNGLSSATGGFLPSSYLQCCSSSARFLGHAIQSADLFYWTAIVMLVFTVFCSLRLRDSRLGRAWIAIREDETAAAAMGIPLMRTKTWAYAGGAFFGGMAGAFYASEKASAFPDDFFFNISVFILCMVILGGMGNVWGVMVGAAFLAYLNKFGLGNIGNWINTHLHAFGHHAHVDVNLYESGIYGVIIVIVMLTKPEGILPSVRRARELHDPDPHDTPLYDVQHGGA